MPILDFTDVFSPRVLEGSIDVRVTEAGVRRVIEAENAGQGSLHAFSDPFPFVGGIFINDLNIWVTPETFVNNNGVWVTPLSAYVKDNGIWKRIL